eukprot:Rhum_TRINITY_DN14924_c11_g1::Rhum_TRINITY_DN14924_c11_g1_i2::g.129085::m.129085
MLAARRVFCAASSEEGAEAVQHRLVVRGEELTGALLDVALRDLGVRSLLRLDLLRPPVPVVRVVVLQPGKARLLRHQRLSVLVRLAVTRPQRVVERVQDDAPRQTRASRRHSLLRLVVEADDAPHHPHRLVQRAEPVVRGVGVLLQEVRLDHLTDVDGDLVLLTQRVLADQLHDLGQVLVLLEERRDGDLHGGEVGHGEGILRRTLGLEHLPVLLGTVLLVVRLKRLRVLRVGDGPVQGREMLTLRKLLVESPEDLHNAERGRRHRVGEVTTRRRHGSHHGDGSLPRRLAEALHAARTLVEGRETGTQVRRVSTVGRHLRKTTGDLTKGLGPTRRGVRHHRHIETHVTHVLSDRDTRVDGRLPGRHRHVGRVRDQHRAQHDRVLLAVLRRLQLRELHEHLSHLVSTLTAADVDDGVGVRVLRQRLGDDRLAAPEGSRHGAGSALHGREQRVQHTLARLQRRLGTQLAVGGDGTRLTNGPLLDHGKLPLRSVLVQLHLQNVVLVGVLAGRRNLRDLAAEADVAGRGREHDGVGRDQVVLTDHAVHVAVADHGAHLHRGGEGELLLVVQRRHVETLRDEHVSDHARDGLQRTLDTVEDLTEDAGSQLERQGLARTHNLVADRQTGSLLVHLDGGGVLLQTDDLTDQLGGAHLHKLVHGSAKHALTDHDGTGHGLNLAMRTDLSVGVELLHSKRHNARLGVCSPKAVPGWI